MNLPKRPLVPSTEADWNLPVVISGELVLVLAVMNTSESMDAAAMSDPGMNGKENNETVSRDDRLN
jgi:hypothetical protein